MTDFEIAFAVFYIAVILIAIGFLSTRGVIALAVLCICLTVVSLLLTRHGSFEAGLFNCGISACAIGITTYLGLKTVAAQAAVYDAQEQFGRMARLNGLVNAVVTLDLERARAAAAKADDALARGDAVGPLHGLPVTIKDAIETEGIRSTGGAVELTDHVPSTDAVVLIVRQARSGRPVRAMASRSRPTSTRPQRKQSKWPVTRWSATASCCGSILRKTWQWSWQTKSRYSK